MGIRWTLSWHVLHRARYQHTCALPFRFAVSTLPLTHSGNTIAYHSAAIVFKSSCILLDTMLVLRAETITSVLHADLHHVRCPFRRSRSWLRLRSSGGSISRPTGPAVLKRTHITPVALRQERSYSGASIFRHLQCSNDQCRPNVSDQFLPQRLASKVYPHIRPQYVEIWRRKEVVGTLSACCLPLRLLIVS